MHTCALLLSLGELARQVISTIMKNAENRPTDAPDSRISIKDIARAAGVSHSTVSRALNNNPLISEPTRSRIKTFAAQMGYTPNAVARSLKAQRSGTIGLALTSLTDPFFADVMAGVEAVAGDAGLSMFVSATHNDPEREMEIIETFHRRRVEGIIVAASRLSNRYRDRLEGIRVPIVLINQHAEESQPMFHAVAFDEFSGAHLIVDYLVSLGHRRIGYLGLGNRQRSNHLRLSGYRAALLEVGITADSTWELVIPSSDIQNQPDIAVGMQHIPALIARGVTAIFCYNDRVAVGGLQACRQNAVTVPGDISIAGFDDIVLAKYITPSLTTVRQPRDEMGRLATELILSLLEGDPGQSYKLSPKLVKRDSTDMLAQV